jgi:ketosteroid isomerase-like protein
MSRENVENLRAFLEDWSREAWTPEAWERGGVGGVIDMSFLDPDVVYEDTTLPDHIGEKYRGHEGVERAARRWIEPQEWMLVELQQIIEVGDRLVSVHHVRSKARHSGIEFDTRDGDVPGLAYLWTIRNGKVIHFKSFPSLEKALEAAGLSE